MQQQLRGREGIEVSSAGLQAMVGKPIDPMAATLLHERGLESADHRGRQASSSVLVAADLILVMERAHVARITRDVPQVSGKTFLLGHWDDVEIPDPYRQQRIAFEHVYALIERGVSRWSTHIK